MVWRGGRRKVRQTSHGHGRRIGECGALVKVVGRGGVGIGRVLQQRMGQHVRERMRSGLGGGVRMSHGSAGDESVAQRSHGGVRFAGGGRSQQSLDGETVRRRRAALHGGGGGGGGSSGGGRVEQVRQVGRRDLRRVGGGILLSGQQVSVACVAGRSGAVAVQGQSSRVAQRGGQTGPTGRRRCVRAAGRRSHRGRRRKSGHGRVRRHVDGHSGETTQRRKAEAALEGGETRTRGGRGATAQLAGGAADEDVVAGRVQHPVVALARVVVVARHFDEAFVEAEVVADRVLPSLFVVAVVGKVLHDELVDAVEGQTLFGAAADGHHDESVVGERRLFVLLLLTFTGALLLGRVRLLTVGRLIDVLGVVVVALLVVTFNAFLTAGRPHRRLGRAVECVFGRLLFRLGRMTFDGTTFHTFHVQVFVAERVLDLTALVAAAVQVVVTDARLGRGRRVDELRPVLDGRLRKQSQD